MATETSSTSDNTEIFRQLETYPWDTDKEFQGGLSAILGPNPSHSPSQTQELTIRAQCFYLSRKKNIPIDFDAYKTYLASKSPSSFTNQPTETSSLTSTTTANMPSPTNSNENHPPHPHHESGLPPASAAPPQSSPSNPSSTTETPPKTAPYPPTFAEIVALITSGQPIPGIKEIPPTLLTSQATKPVASKRRKPWEKDVPDSVVQGGEAVGGTFGDQRDRVVEQVLPED